MKNLNFTPATKISILHQPRKLTKYNVQSNRNFEFDGYWKKCLRIVVERWIEEMILTLARQSQPLSLMCTWKISGVFTERDSNLWPLQYRCSAPTNIAMKPLRREQGNLLGSFVPCSHLSDFIVQLERALHRHRKGRTSYCIIRSFKEAEQ